MRMVGFYAWHTFVNSIKKMFRSAVMIVIALIVAIGLIFGIVAGIISSIVSSSEKTPNAAAPETVVSEMKSDTMVDSEAILQSELTVDSETILQSELTGDDEASLQEDADDSEMDAESAGFMKACVEAGIELLVIAILLWGIYAGSKKGSDIFLMADVNFLFTAPIRPQSVLMFRLSFQMATTLVGSVYLLFQIPNLVSNLGLSLFSVMIIFLAWILLLILQKLLSVLSYTVAASNEKRKDLVLPIVIAIAAAVLITTGAVYLSAGRELPKMLSVLYTSGWSRMIPFIGWYKGMIMAAVEGNFAQTFMYLGMLLVGMVLLVILIWHVKADFYEDAMTGAATRDEVQNAAKEGRKVAKKEHSRKIKRNTELGGYGANVFLQKELYNRRRFARFGFLTNTMSTYLLLAVGGGILCQKVLEVNGFLTLGIVIAGFVFFRNYGNPIAVETSMNWLYLVPESPYKKVFYAMLAGTCSCALDVLPALVVGGILTKAPVYEMALWWLMLVTMDFMLSSVGMLLEVLLPASALDLVKSMLQMILKMMMIVVIAALFAVGYLLAGIWLSLLLNTLVSCIIGAVIFWIYPSMLHEGVK